MMMMSLHLRDQLEVVSKKDNGVSSFSCVYLGHFLRQTMFFVYIWGVGLLHGFPF